MNKPSVEYSVWVSSAIQTDLRAMDLPAAKSEKGALSQAKKLLKQGATRVIVERVERQILFDSKTAEDA